MKNIVKKILLSMGFDINLLRRFVYGYYRSYEENRLITEYLLLHSSPGVLIDVGVAFGSVSLPFLKAGWDVYGFEPDNNSKKLSEIELLKCNPNFHFDNRAVSNVSGEKMKFYISDESAGISSLHSFSDHKLSHEVMTVTLRDFILESKIEDVDFLKIDTEGHDLFVLEGFPFRSIQPRIIIAEFDEKKSISVGYKYRRLGDYLLGLGYKVYLSEWYPIERYGGQHKFRRIYTYPCELLDKEAWGNFIAIRKDESNNFESFIQERPIMKYCNLESR